MGHIFLTSDTHWGHDREFLWGPRGCKNIQEHNDWVGQRFLSVLEPDDDLYILGDLMLGDNSIGMEYLRRLPCRIHIVRGNHDTDTRWELYKTLPNVVEMADVIRLKHGKYRFYLSHYPTLTGNLESEHLTQMEINLYGHTHQQTNFFKDMPFMYHVGVDSHDCLPVLLDDIIEECKAKVRECIDYL
jgi:calcineurin-like phosphoesterase family protein